MSKVSIIVPSYNSEKHIKKCLDSLFSQTHADIEVLLIDDCSKDHSYNLVKRYKEKEPYRLKLIRNPENKGAGASRNIGLDIAEGKYIGFVDSDDYIDLNAVQKMHDSLEQTGADISRINRKIVYKGQNISFIGRKQNIKPDGIIIPKEDISYLTEETPAVTNKLFRRELIGEKRFPEDLKWEDYPFSVPLMYRSNAVVTAQDVSYYYNLNLLGTTVTDASKVSPKLLDIFTCSDMIRGEILTDKSSEELKNQIDFLCIQNCLQRIRDVFYSKMPTKDKIELINMISTLINKKYGNWQSNPLYQKFKRTRMFYYLRMDFIEKLIINNDYDELSIPELEEHVQKVLTKKNH